MLCCKKPEDDYEENHRKLIKELIHDAPVKDELATHDGVVWFPRELMPKEIKQEHKIGHGMNPPS